MQPYEELLAGLEARGRLRQLAPAAGHDFTSNDFLGLADSRRAEGGDPGGFGPWRSGRRGRLPAAARQPSRACRPGGGGGGFFGAESALYFSSGFAANYALFAALPQRGDLVVYDALIHASAHDGMHAGRAELAEAAHNDAAAFEDKIRAWRAAGGKGRPWIAVESLYSMDGDRAPLADLAEIARRHDGMLAVDEAHATGVFGPDGRGLGAMLEGRPDVISLHTCGKGLGAAGALLCGPRVLERFPGQLFPAVHILHRAVATHSGGGPGGLAPLQARAGAARAAWGADRICEPRARNTVRRAPQAARRSCR